MPVQIAELQSPDVYAQSRSKEDHLQVEVDKKSDRGKQTELLYGWDKCQEPENQ